MTALRLLSLARTTLVDFGASERVVQVLGLRGWMLELNGSSIARGFNIAWLGAAGMGTGVGVASSGVNASVAW